MSDKNLKTPEELGAMASTIHKFLTDAGASRSEAVSVLLGLSSKLAREGGMREDQFINLVNVTWRFQKLPTQSLTPTIHIHKRHVNDFLVEMMCGKQLALDTSGRTYEDDHDFVHRDVPARERMCVQCLGKVNDANPTDSNQN